ncbi:MAG: hypothetical protein KDC26_00800 [Armatimonadetes bacterium]|nr:hypothetical protein [Armatimonadota bacterium]
MTAGQVFRWQEVEPDNWRGADGANWYQVQVCSGHLNIVSNADKKAFESLFRLDENYALLREEFCEREPRFREVADATKGLRSMRCSDPVEVLLAFICSSLNNIPRITNMMNHLAGGELFPRLEQIAMLQEQGLREAGFGYRAKYVCGASRLALELGGEDWLQSLRNQPTEMAIQELMTLPGVGRKVAECIALIGLDKTDAVPVDTHVAQAVKRIEKTSSTITNPKTRDWITERFGNKAGLAQQMLFYWNLTSKR